MCFCAFIWWLVPGLLVRWLFLIVFLHLGCLLMTIRCYGMDLLFTIIPLSLPPSLVLSCFNDLSSESHSSVNSYHGPFSAPLINSWVFLLVGNSLIGRFSFVSPKYVATHNRLIDQHQNFDMGWGRAYQQEQGKDHIRVGNFQVMVATWSQLLYNNAAMIYPETSLWALTQLRAVIL